MYGATRSHTAGWLASSAPRSPRCGGPGQTCRLQPTREMIPRSPHVGTRETPGAARDCLFTTRAQSATAVALAPSPSRGTRLQNIPSPDVTQPARQNSLLRGGVWGCFAMFPPPPHQQNSLSWGRGGRGGSSPIGVADQPNRARRPPCGDRALTLGRRDWTPRWDGGPPSAPTSSVLGESVLKTPLLRTLVARFVAR